MILCHVLVLSPTLWCRAGCRITLAMSSLMHSHRLLLQSMFHIAIGALVVALVGWVCIDALEFFGADVA